MEMISNGGFSPLIGFMGEKDYQSVLKYMYLANGLPWTLPVTLPVTKAGAKSINLGDEVALNSDEGELSGVIQVEEMFEYDKQEEARLIYKTIDPNHLREKNYLSKGISILLGLFF
jgi:sulfate adenylyltransferase